MRSKRNAITLKALTDCCILWSFPYQKYKLETACTTCLQYVSKKDNHTLFLKPSNVDQSSVLSAAHQRVQSLLARSQTSLCASRQTRLSQFLTVPGTALQQPHHHSQQSTAQANALLCFSMTAVETKDRQCDEETVQAKRKADLSFVQDDLKNLK